MTRRIMFAAACLCAAPLACAESGTLYYVEAERLEYRERDREGLWDLQGWAGGDVSKFWWKTEGHVASGSAESAELQALYSRAVSPYFDLQLGLRHDVRPASGSTHAVIGLQGLAPFWFEIDAAAFLSEDGDLSGRFEVEYDLLLTQKLMMQPRLEFNLGDKLRTTDLDLRLRYEIRRKIAPYIGVGWHFDHDRGKDSLSLLAGASFWF